MEGHGRLLAAKQLGMKTVPCIHLDHLTDAQRRAYALAHNRTAELSAWIDDILGSELDALADLDFDMSEFGFDPAEKDTVVEDNYEPVIPEEPKAKPGDIYQLGRHRLMCGDSTNLEQVEELTDGQVMDMLLTDPPYNVDYNAKEQDLVKYRPNKRVNENKLTDISNDKMSNDAFREFLRSAFVCARAVLKPGGVFHVWHAETEAYNFRGGLQDAGFTCRQQLIWVKSNISIGRQDFQRQYEGVLTGDTWLDDEMEEQGYEPCLYGWKDGAGHVWMKKRKEKDVMFFDKPMASKEHPTMKPVLLYDYEMKCNTRPGDKVLDLFTGSGTTIIAAEQNGRTAYCMELDPRFVDVIIDRWEKLTGDKAVKVAPKATTEEEDTQDVACEATE